MGWVPVGGLAAGTHLLYAGRGEGLTLDQSIALVHDAKEMIWVARMGDAVARG